MDERNIQQYLSGRRLSFDPRLIKILVVDDEMVSRLVLKRLLEKSGYSDITLVDGAPAALRLLQEGNTFHLIVSDVKMPVMSGLDFLCELQKHERFTSIPVIMVSALDELQLVYQCLQQGACDFLVKPVKHGMVHNLWQNVWRKRREKKLLEMYQREQGERSKSEVELKQEIDSLQNQISEAVITPVKAISSALTKLLNDGTLTESVRGTLAEILKQMQTSQLYKPVVHEFILQKSAEQLDDQTKAWFEREFSLSSLATNLPENPGNSGTTTTTTTTTTTQTSTITPSESTPSFSFLSNPNYSILAAKVRLWDFNVWEIPDEESLFIMFHVMFSEFGLLTRFKISDHQFRQFLLGVRKLYHDKNPYHNFRHAFDVTHMIFLLLARAHALQHLEQLEMYTILLCGLLHDVDHPGVNNTFQILTESQLAIRYNDQSVLENHHCSCGYSVLGEFQMLAGFEIQEKMKFRKLFVDCVLATDLSRHMKSLSDLDTLIATLENSQGISRANEEHRTTLSRMIMKAADLSNPAKPFSVAKYWAELIQEEFFLQGDQEKVLGLTISPFMERGKSSLPQMQINFAGFIVIPLFQSLAKILPEIHKVILPVLLDNRQRWTEILKAEDFAKNMFQQKND